MIDKVLATLKEHFSEVLLTGILAALLVFVLFTSHSHNDQLASKGSDLAAQTLAAILTLLVSSKKPPAS